jgi:Mg/Co/Ni transporter MgtE
MRSLPSSAILARLNGEHAQRVFNRMTPELAHFAVASLTQFAAINTMAGLSGEAANRIVEEMSPTMASLTLRAITPNSYTGCSL